MINDEYDNFGNKMGMKEKIEDSSLLDVKVEDPTNPNTITDGQINAEIKVVKGFIESSNYVSGTTGWKLNYDGTVDFPFMVGMIADFAGSTAPTGWLLCDGSAVSRTDYAGLYSVVGIIYGAGDGSTTFNLPDCRGKVSVAKSSDTEFDVLGETGGEKTHTLTSGESGLVAHNHTASDSGHAHDSNWKVSSTESSGYGLTQTAAFQNRVSVSGGGNTNTGTGYASITVNNNTASNASSAHNNLQPYITLNKIIKY